MKRLALTTITLLAVVVLAGGAAAHGSGRSDSMQVLVVLARQASLPSSQSGQHGDRVGEVVQALHDEAATTQRPLLQLLSARRAQGRVDSVTPLWIFNGVLVTAKPDVVQELAARADVREVRIVRTLRAADSLAASPPEPNVSLVGAPALWDLGNHGEGVVVATLDTGVDAGHPDLAASWRGGANSWFDPYGQHATGPADLNGHGTETMGVIVGSSVGVAPGAKWISAKIFDDSGIATTAAIHRSFQWLLDPDGNPATNDAPNVVNGSWTMGAAGCDLEFQLDLRALRAAGILPVFAAGNGGPSAGTSYSPANNPEALSVGSTDLTDTVHAASSRGPSACDAGVFPKLVAPGVDVRTTALYNGYVTATGTSLAAPHVAGALALLLHAQPQLAADRQEAALENGAVDLAPAGPDNDSGFGRLSVPGAYDWLRTAPDFSVTPSPASVATTSGSTASVSVAVAGLNGFAGDVALSVAGLDATQATATFSPATIAGGTGTSTLSIVTAATLAAGSYGLTITGSSGTTTRTAYATLQVSPPPDFTLAATPSSASTLPGAGVGYSVAIGSLNGFAGDVALRLSGLTASQATWSFAPATVAGAGTSTVTVTTASTIVPATYALTITGTSGATTHTTTVNLVVVPPPDFTLAASPTSLSAVAGSTFTYSLNVGAKNGFGGDVALSLTGLSASQASWKFAPPTVAGSGRSTLTVTTVATLAPATYKLTITGVSGALSHTAAVNMVVTAPPDFTISASPASASVTAGTAASYTVTLASKGGFAGSVALSMAGAPAGTTATFSPNPRTSPGTSTLKVQTGASTPKGTFALTITGTSGTLSHQTSVSLTVR